MKIILIVIPVFLFLNGCGKDSPNEFNKEDYKIEAEEMPAPVGGIKTIQEKVIYPEDAKDEEIEGTVLINTFINEKGEVVWTEISKSAHPILDSAAINAIKKVKFTPGKHKGKNVKVQVIVPVAFKLE